MRRSVLLITLLFIMAITSACHQSRFSINRCKSVYKPQYATGFEILRDTVFNYNIIQIRNPFQGSKDFVQNIIVAENNSALPSAFDGQIIRSAKSIGVMSSSYVAFLDALGECNRISGVSGLGFVSNPTIHSNASLGKTWDIGFDPNLDYERIVANQTDLMMIYGVSSESTSSTDKLRELGIPYIYIGEYVEELPLGKSEWIVAIAALCGCMEKGIDVFEQTEWEYLQAVAAKKDYPALKVMLNTPYNDVWYMPSKNSYMVHLIEDAGGQYIYDAEGNSSVAISIEEAMKLSSEADIWLNPGQYNTLSGLTESNPKFAKCKAVTEQMVFNNNARVTEMGGSDFWESGAVRPQYILRDLIGIFSAQTDSLYYYKRLTQ